MSKELRFDDSYIKKLFIFSMAFGGYLKTVRDIQ
jgi:hypothetical protein